MPVCKVIGPDELTAMPVNSLPIPGKLVIGFADEPLVIRRRVVCVQFLLRREKSETERENATPHGL
ncbi:MAG: hypothetical protein O2931_03325 [Planctomycetota bacterium]|nr:hypothetical protein [Planctomycetota bacterium]MDA1177808.1 hypothetical protein [Planctomycetota bacterium]